MSRRFKLKPKVCLHCEAIFEPASPRQKYCNKRCAANYAYAHNEIYRSANMASSRKRQKGSCDHYEMDYGFDDVEERYLYVCLRCGEQRYAGTPEEPRRPSNWKIIRETSIEATL